jgi:hypothetical protein
MTPGRVEAQATLQSSALRERSIFRCSLAFPMVYIESTRIGRDPIPAEDSPAAAK